MGTGYTRQSSADIITGANITASPLNAEVNAIQSAFNSTTGHTHDGTSGEGPLINLTTSVTGILPNANVNIGTSGATIPVLNANNTFSGTTTLTTVDINGGTIDGTPIGGATPSTGVFTTLGTSSTLTVNGRISVNSGGDLWSTYLASTPASSYMSFYRGASLGGILGYIGSDGGGAISSGTGTGLAIRSEADLILAPAGGTEVMRLNSSGQVTMPYQPVFHAYKSGAGQTATGVIEFAGVTTNVGSHYNNSTYRFTAPVDGTYHFYANWFASLPAAGDYAACSFYKNGSIIGATSHTTTTSVALSYIRVPATINLTLSAGDYVDFRLFTTYGTAGVYAGGYSEFGGWLIG